MTEAQQAAQPLTPDQSQEANDLTSENGLPVGRQPLISECLLNSAEKLIKLSDEISEIEQHQDKHDRPEFEACSICDSWSQKNRDFRHEAEHAALSFAYKIRSAASLPVGESRWISVEEKLPEDDATVLAAIPSYDNDRKLTDVEVLHCTYWIVGGQKIFTTCEGEEYLAGDVTHWMSLPKPPKLGLGESRELLPTAIQRHSITGQVMIKSALESTEPKEPS